MANNEFLNDHQHPPLEEENSSSLIFATGKNENVQLLEEQTSPVVADGTFLVDDGSSELLTQSHPHHPQISDPREDDDMLLKSEQAAVADSSPVDSPNNSLPHCSVIGDFELIATERESVKMDNIPGSGGASGPPVGNLVETLLTSDDLKPHKEAAAAYLENEFAQLPGELKQSQDLNFYSTEQLKDASYDFMEAERGVRAGNTMQRSRDESPEPLLMKKEEEKVEPTKPIESIPPFVATGPTVTEVPQEHSKDDMLDFEDKNVVEDSWKLQKEEEVPPAKINVKAEEFFSEEPKKNVDSGVPVKKQESHPEPVAVKETASPKEFKSDELIATSAEEMFCKFGLGE